jgi:hypothetical protein
MMACIADTVNVEQLVREALDFDRLPPVVVRAFTSDRKGWRRAIEGIKQDLAAEEAEKVDISGITASTLADHSDVFMALQNEVRGAAKLHRYENRTERRVARTRARDDTTADDMMTAAECHRAMADAVIAARWVTAKARAVIDFREQVLGGVMLAPADVEAYLHDPKHGAVADLAVAVGEITHVRKDGTEASVPYAQGSILARLSLLAVNLSIRYPWKPSQAVMYVLTNTAPTFSPVCYFPTGDPFRPLGLKIAPWVLPATVVRYYQRAQRRLLPAGRQRFQLLGQHGYSRAYHVTAFYGLQRLANANCTYEEVFRAWNAQWSSQGSPGDRIRTRAYEPSTKGYKLFRQDLRRGMNGLLWPEAKPAPAVGA